MRVAARSFLPGALVAAMLVTLAPAAASAAEFGVERFFAANCVQLHEKCAEEPITTYPTEPTLSEAYTQAAGHPPWGATTFKINTEGTFPNEAPSGILTSGPVTHVRTDVAPGVSTDPEAVPKCSFAEFGGEAIPGSGLFPAPNCKTETEIGENKVVVWLGPKPSPEGGDLPLHGKVYNLIQPEGLASDFGVALELPMAVSAAALAKGFKEAEEKGAVPGVGGFPSLPEQAFLEAQQYYAHTLIEGHIEWAGDYHDYYEINVSPKTPLISSRLVLKGNILLAGKENGGFITNPSRCEGPGPLTTNTVSLKAAAGQEGTKTYTTPIGPAGCLGEAGFTAPPFEPSFALISETSQSDLPNGLTTEVSLPHDPSPTGIDSSQLRNATVVLPEGMSLNPSAAHGLVACTPTQFGIKTRRAVECPLESRVATVQLTVPDLPASEPLEGNVYLGGGPTIENPPYKLYVDAESARYGISTRLEGTVTPNEATGRLTTTFLNNPEQPFTNIKLNFGVRGNALAPIANPLSCGTALTETSFVPYTGGPTKTPTFGFIVDSNGKGGACASPLPFSLSQSTEDHPTTGAANTNFTFNLTRADGQQYLSKVSTTLPEGLVGKIPAVPLCGEPQANAGTCPESSRIGTATVTVGSGSAPSQFSGPVYLTGPTGKDPYGMTVVINAAVGPFNLGPVVVRAGIAVDQFTTRVTVTSELPTIIKGIPTRLRTLSVAVNRQGFLINPTNCGPLATESSLTSTLGGTQVVSTPFQATECASLAFAPKLTASTSGKASKANGTSFKVKIGYPVGVQANVKSVFTQLPKQLPSRLSTLRQACVEATFNANPAACPAGSRVGTATAITPVLPGQMTGPAYFVSHGGAAFPDLDLVLSGNGVTVILVGNTNITKGITTTTFASVPDVPVSSFELSLPAGKNSALSANGNLCAKPLSMPTTITAQNGKVLKQNTRISVPGCGVQIISHRVHGHHVILKLQVPAAGKLTVGGSFLQVLHRTARGAGRLTVSVALTRSGVNLLNLHGILRTRVKVRFVPSKGRASTAQASVTFKSHGRPPRREPGRG